MSRPPRPQTGSRFQEFLGPSRSAQPETNVRFNARERLLSLDQYEAVPQLRQGFYSTPGRGVNGESSN